MLLARTEAERNALPRVALLDSHTVRSLIPGGPRSPVATRICGAAEFSGNFDRLLPPVIWDFEIA
jgi:hypothetical protein